jgi:hypothetical protein
MGNIRKMNLYLKTFSISKRFDISTEKAKKLMHRTEPCYYCHDDIMWWLIADDESVHIITNKKELGVEGEIYHNPIIFL